MTSLRSPMENGVISLHKPQQRPAMNCPHASHPYATQITHEKGRLSCSFLSLVFACFLKCCCCPCCRHDQCSDICHLVLPPKCKTSSPSSSNRPGYKGRPGCPLSWCVRNGTGMTGNQGQDCFTNVKGRLGSRSRKVGDEIDMARLSVRSASGLGEG